MIPSRPGLVRHDGGVITFQTVRPEHLIIAVIDAKSEELRKNKMTRREVNKVARNARDKRARFIEGFFDISGPPPSGRSVSGRVNRETSRLPHGTEMDLFDFGVSPAEFPEPEIDIEAYQGFTVIPTKENV